MAGHVAPYPNELRTCIKLAGFSIRKVSKETNIPESTLHDWASGNRVIPHQERQILASLLDCDVKCLAPRICSSLLPQTLLDGEERDLPSESENTIPERHRLGIVNGQSQAAILDNDTERYADHLEDALVGSVRLGSQKRFDEALAIFQEEMPASWLLVDCIKQLVEQYGLKRAG